MTRIAHGQLSRRMLNDVLTNYRTLERAGRQVSSGFRIEKPGDGDVGGPIQGFRNTLDRVASFQQRAGAIRSQLNFQDDVARQSVELMQRAKELATQAANETYDVATRAQLAQEFFQMRDQLVTFANSQYQGRYIYGLADDDDPPFDAAAGGYTAPASGAANARMVFDNEAGTDVAQTVYVTDSIAVTVANSADQIFSRSVAALERLGRALAGYDTTLDSGGLPTGAGAAFTGSNIQAQQTTAIQSGLDALDVAMNQDLLPERVDIGARLKRLDVVDSVLLSTKQTATEALNSLQNADSATAISQYQQAQFSLQAAMEVTSRVLNLSILDYL